MEVDSDPSLTRPTWDLRDIFARVLAVRSQATSLPLCAAHAAFLEAGLNPAWSSEVGFDSK